MENTQYVSFSRTAFGTISRSKLERIQKRAGFSILDVGCGPGLYIEQLMKLGHKMIAVDKNPVFVNEALKYTEEVYQVDLDKMYLSQFPDASVDTVLMLDVLEHVDDDMKLLKDAARVARKNVLLSVPAQIPKGMEDTQLVFASYTDPTHRRYYTLENLQNTLEHGGFHDYYIESVLRFRPIISDIFPWYIKIPLRAINSLLNRITDQKMLTSVWFAAANKSR